MNELSVDFAAFLYCKVTGETMGSGGGGGSSAVTVMAGVGVRTPFYMHPACEGTTPSLRLSRSPLPSLDGLFILWCNI